MGGGGGGIPIPVGVGGTGGIILVIVIIVLNLLASSGSGSGSLGTALDPIGGNGSGVEPNASVDLSNNGDLVEFVGYVLDDTNALWADTFQRSGQSYTPARMVLFDTGTQSGCGPASKDTGPFYCPVDQKVPRRISPKRCSMRAGSCPMSNSRAWSMMPSTPRPRPPKLASPIPVMPSSVRMSTTTIA